MPLFKCEECQKKEQETPCFLFFDAEEFDYEQPTTCPYKDFQEKQCGEVMKPYWKREV